MAIFDNASVSLPKTGLLEELTGESRSWTEAPLILRTSSPSGPRPQEGRLAGGAGPVQVSAAPPGRHVDPAWPGRAAPSAPAAPARPSWRLTAGRIRAADRHAWRRSWHRSARSGPCRRRRRIKRRRRRVGVPWWPTPTQASPPCSTSLTGAGYPRQQPAL